MIEFYKMSGSGNDFIIIDNMDCHWMSVIYPISPARFASEKYPWAQTGWWLLSLPTSPISNGVFQFRRFHGGNVR